MTYLLFGLGILALVLAIGTQLQKANPAALARWLRRLGAALALALGVYLIATGRIVHALPALVGGALLLGRLRQMGFARGGGPRRQGRTSEVQTTYLRARLDHDTGTVSGTILRGAYAGRELGELAEADLVALYRECLGEDEEAARLVEAFLDRGPHAATWRDRRGARPADAAAAPMTADEARRVLGVAPDADQDAIREAHRRLMLANHPDHGGSDYLAAKINQARDVLLGQHPINGNHPGSN